MDKREIVFNLWYLTDQSGSIFSLKAKMYVHSGSDEEKTKFLQSRALLDYFIAEDFEIPSQFRANIEGKVTVSAHLAHVMSTGGEFNLFIEVIDKLEKRLTPLCPLKISETPIVCITPLHFTDDFQLVPFDKMRPRKI